MDKKRKPSMRLEKGNIIDQIGSIFVVLFMFTIIFTYSAYGQIVQKRLAIDNVAKEYLYQMEEIGYLTDSAEASLIADMSTIGATVKSLSADGKTTNKSQVAYGDQVVLAINLEFPNPLFAVFNKDGLLFSYMGFNPILNYNVVMSSTAKW